MRNTHRLGLIAGLAGLLTLAPMSPAHAAIAPSPIVFGFAVSLGGRYDNVRLCVASGKDVPGGFAADISFFTEVPVSDDIKVVFNIPVMRPVVFGMVFNMLQFEPYATLIFRVDGGNIFDFVAGPSLGFSLHYGPDWHSETDGPSRSPSFFAIGPRVGAYAGFDFKRPGELFNFQLGIHPYFEPLWGIGDAQNHQGFVVGGMLDSVFRFSNTY